jgi:hypothetical protein
MFFGFMSFLVQIQFLHVLRFVESISLLTNTLTSSKGTITSFGFLTILLFTTFTLAMALMFREVSGYETIYTAIGSNLASMLNKFRYDTVAEGTGVVGGAFLLMYVLTMMIIVINFFVSLLNELLAVMKKHKNQWGKDTEVMEHLIQMLKSMFSDRHPDNKQTTSKCFVSLLTLQEKSY